MKYLLLFLLTGCAVSGQESIWVDKTPLRFDHIEVRQRGMETVYIAHWKDWHNMDYVADVRAEDTASIRYNIFVLKR